VGFDQHEADESISGINVTPLVDVTLVLLIIFMATASYIVHPSIKVELPRAASGDKSKPSTISVVLARDGDLFLNGRRATREELTAKVRTEVEADPDLQVVISADTALAYGRVVWLLDLVKRLGVRRYALNIKYPGED